MGIITNIKKRGLKDIFSFRVFSWIESQFQKVFGVRTKQKDQIAYSEQIIFRGCMCSDCKENGSCLHCGCNFNDLQVSKVATCSQGRWGKIMNKEDWENYKSKYLSNVDFGFVKKRVKEDGNQDNK